MIARPSIVRSPLRRVAVGLVAAFAVVTLAAGCSSSSEKSSEAKYCDSWQNVVDAFQSFDGVTITLDGVKGLDTAIGNVKSAVNDLASSADTLMQPKVQAFADAVTSLADTLKSPQISTSYLDRLQTEKQTIESTWNDMITTAKTSCPDVKASSV